jgi:alkylation response protein AidB-like acyl-CoA dehydrogenase
MDFDDTLEEAAFRAEVRAWLTVAKGHAAITWPKAFGGSGGSEIQRILFQQEQSTFDVSTMHGTVFSLSASI